MPKEELKLKHLNSILRSIRNINQLIVKEKDKKKLIKHTCINFTKENGYYNAWIALVDDEGKITETAESRVGKDFQALVKRIKKGKLTACYKQAMSSPNIIINKNPKKDCADCPLAKSYRGRGAMIVKLEHKKKVFGILSASVPLEYIDEKEGKKLFSEIAADISFALFSIEQGEKIKEIFERLKLAMDSGEHGFWDWNLDTDNVYYSPCYFTMLGYKPGDFPGRKETWVTLMHPEDRKTIVPKVDKYVKNAEPYEVEFRLKTKEGSWKWISGKGKSYNIDKYGVSHRAVGFHVDITNLKKAEILIRSERDKAQKYLDIARVMIVVLDKSGKVNLVNKEGCNILEHTYDEIVGKNWFDNFTPKRLRPDARKVLKKMFSGKVKLVEYYENPVISKSGKEKLIAWHNTVVKDSSGKIVSTLASGKDITKFREQSDSLRLSHAKLEKALSSIIDTLASVVEIQDPYTAGHQKNVAKLAKAISEKLGLPKDLIGGIDIAAKIHDIGKLVIPASILSKPGKISDIEHELIKTHPKVGCDMIKNIEFQWPIAEMVLQHHERLDGSGYPNGLKDKNIILGAKIIGVADVVEAISSHRPYRPSLGIKKTLEEISTNKGKLYDSKVVDVCINLFKKEKFKFN